MYNTIGDSHKYPKYSKDKIKYLTYKKKYLEAKLLHVQSGGGNDKISKLKEGAEREETRNVVGGPSVKSINKFINNLNGKFEKIAKEKGIDDDRIHVDRISETQHPVLSGVSIEEMEKIVEEINNVMKRISESGKKEEEELGDGKGKKSWKDIEFPFDDPESKASLGTASISQINTMIDQINRAISILNNKFVPLEEIEGPVSRDVANALIKEINKINEQLFYEKNKFKNFDEEIAEFTKEYNGIIKKHEENVEIFEKDLQNLKNIKTYYNKMTDKVVEDGKNMAGIMEDAKYETINAKNEIQQVLNKYNLQVGIYKQDLLDLKKTKKQYEKRVHDNSLELKNIKDQYRNKIKEIDGLPEKYKRYADELMETIELFLNSTKEQYSDGERFFETLKKRTNELLKRIETTTDESDKTKKECESLFESLQQINEEYEKKYEQIKTDYKQDQIQLTQLIQANSKQMAKLTQLFENYSAKLNEAQSLVNLEEEIKEKLRKMDKFKEELENSNKLFRQKINKLELDKCAQIIKDLQGKFKAVSNTDEKLKQILTNIASLEKQLENLENNGPDLTENQINNISEQVSVILKTQIDDAKNEYLSEIADKLELWKQNNLEQLNNNEQTLASYKQKFDEFSKLDLDSLKQELQQLIDNFDKTKAKITKELKGSIPDIADDKIYEIIKNYLTDDNLKRIIKDINAKENYIDKLLEEWKETNMTNLKRRIKTLEGKYPEGNTDISEIKENYAKIMKEINKINSLDLGGSIKTMKNLQDTIGNFLKDTMGESKGINDLLDKLEIEFTNIKNEKTTLESLKAELQNEIRSKIKISEEQVTQITKLLGNENLRGLAELEKKLKENINVVMPEISDKDLNTLVGKLIENNNFINKLKNNYPHSEKVQKIISKYEEYDKKLQELQELRENMGSIETVSKSNISDVSDISDIARVAGIAGITGITGITGATINKLLNGNLEGRLEKLENNPHVQLQINYLKNGIEHIDKKINNLVKIIEAMVASSYAFRNNKRNLIMTF